MSLFHCIPLYDYLKLRYLLDWNQISNCGEGTDVVIDFNITENDDNVGDCEEIIGIEAVIVGK